MVRMRTRRVSPRVPAGLEMEDDLGTKDNEAAVLQPRSEAQQPVRRQRRDPIPAAGMSLNGGFGGILPQVMRMSSLAVLAAIVGQALRGLIQGDMAWPPILVFVQLIIWLAHAFFLVWRERKASGTRHDSAGWAFRAHLLVHMALLCSVGSMHLLFIPVMLPIAWISLTEGYRKTFPLVGLAFASQVLFQGLFLLPGMRALGLSPETDLSLLLIRLLLQYGLYLVLFGLLGKAQQQHARSEQDNRQLVERLGDKYVQLEEARREMQVQYDRLRSANEQTEDSNRKLTASLAEFFTVQQISQAIGSIFDMNELLKFVNDVIIGVMGVSNSTIAMRSPQSDRMKVLVSSIIDKRELAVFTDYINHDIRNGALSTTAAVLDNTVTPEEYRFVQGRDVRSIVSVPLVAKGQPLGIVLVEQVIPDAFSHETVRLLEIIAQQISIAIDNARLYQQMQEMATVDGLTGAFNRIHFQNRLADLFQEAQESGGELALVMFDIDHFKRFNDTHGHQFGDLVLKTLSAYVKTHLRKSDLFARYGGEEFVILMPHTTLHQAYEKAEELRQGIGKLSVCDQRVSASVTVSMGVSAFPEVSATGISLIKHADDSLYEAKNAGRNLVRMAGTLDV